MLEQASWRVGPVPLYWWVELCPGHLVFRAMSRCVSIGGYGFKNSLGSLSVDGWGCVPAQLVAWPEFSISGAYRLLGGTSSWL